MGTFGSWLAADYSIVGVEHTRDVLRRESFEEAPDVQARGWIRADTTAHLEWDDLDAAITRIAAETKGAVLAGWVFDSDVGYLVAADNQGVVAQLVLNEEMAEEYGAEVPDGLRGSGAEALAAWSSSYAPSSVTVSRILEVLDKERVFAEEGVEELFEIVGLGKKYRPEPAELPDSEDGPRASVESIDAEDLGGYKAPLAWMMDLAYVAGRLMPWRESDFVLGAGEDFIGIWNRESPAQPVERFPLSELGATKAMYRWLELREPWRNRLLDLDKLGGFETLVGAEDETSVGNRRMSWRHARFVLGYGSDFVGIWDRERPDRPVEEYPRTDEGEDTAHRSLEQLLLPMLLKAKHLPGERWAAAGRDPYRLDKPPCLWLVVEEFRDDTWVPYVREPYSGFYVYVVRNPGAAWSLDWERRADGLGEVREDPMVARDLIEIPEDVPRNLLATVQWAVANVAV